MEAEEKEQSHLISHDMTEGSIIWKLLQFSWPLLVGNIFQQLYYTVDSIIVGNFVGSQALAAIGVYTPVYNLMLALFQGISTGATVLVSQSFGSKNKDRLDNVIYISLIMTFVVGLIITALGLGFCADLMRLINTPQEVFQLALDFSRVMFAGIMPVLTYNILCGILRGMGDSVKPLLFLIAASILNVIFEFLFVVQLNLGIKGAAYATLIAQTIAALWALLYLLKSQEKYGLHLKGRRANWILGKELLAVGIPTGLQSMIFNLGFLLQQNLVNSFGSAVIAAYAIEVRLDQFVMMPMNSFTVAMTTFVGQNIGAHKLDRTMEGVKKLFWLSQGIIVVLVAILFIFVESIVGWFTNDVEVVQVGTIIIRTLSSGYILVNAYVILSGAVRGVGDSVAPLLASFSCNVLLRVSLAYTLVHFTHDYRSIFVTIVIAWTSCSIFMIIYYMKGVWKRRIHYITN